MLKNLLVFAVALCCFGLANAQNVFNLNDPLVTYNSAAPAGSATNPGQPAPGIMAKWVRSQKSSINWNTSNFKSYIWNNMSFRLRFPNNYNPANASKYPVMIFLHGGGEISGVYDNELQLLWGAQLFEQRINNGEWNGFMIFPLESSIGWNDYHFSRLNSVLDTLQKYNNADADKVITMGLSSGAYGALAYASIYPQRIATALPASAPGISSLLDGISSWVHIPVWFANGGVDINPDPFSMQAFFTAFRNKGGDIYQSYFVNDGHNTWPDMWNMKNTAGTYITDTYWNNAHKAQPLVFFQNRVFCSGAPVSAKMGITAGFYSYEWQKDGVSITGATSNEYIATQAGTYRVRFMRSQGGVWSAWTPNPVVISTKTCAVDTLFAEHFNFDNNYSSAAAYTKGNFTCQGGIVTTGTDLFTQDATGTQGNRFLINFTNGGTGCTLTAGDKVWNAADPITVSPNTNYEFSFYLGNQNATNLAQIAPVVNGTALIAGYAQPAGTGNNSWTKYSYTWNSGSSTTASIGLINRSATAYGNDFAIDEITFKLPPSVAVGCTPNLLPANGAVITTNTTAALSWATAANASSYDIYLWTGTALPAAPVATVTSNVYNATALTASTQYNWYVVPKNNNGIAATGCSIYKTSFTTPAQASVPTCVSNISPAAGTTVTTGTAVLTWSAAAAATSYDLYLWKGATAPATPTVTLAATSYNATGLTSSSLYNWYVVPRNAAGAATGCNAYATTFITSTASSPGSGVGLKGEYFNSIGLTGPVALSRTDATVNFVWGAGSPAAGQVNYDIFSVRWSGQVQPLYSETYAFYTNSDDGVRLWVNGQLLINNWVDHQLVQNYGLITLTAGVKYDIRMEYYESTGNATAQLLWSSASTPFAIIPQSQLYLPVTSPATGVGLKGDYFNSIGLTGAVALSRTDATVNFAWGAGSPAAGQVNYDIFSVRWTGQVQPLYSETYAFYTNSDDGVRLWVNGQLLINNWVDHSLVQNYGLITLAAGVKYDIRMEYYEYTGNATAQLLWSSASTPFTIIPQSQLFLPATVNRVADVQAINATPVTAVVVSTASLVPASIYPNPVASGQNITLQVNSDNGGVAGIQILNTTGNVMQSEQVNLGPGANTKTIHTAGLRPGLYMVNVSGNVSKATTLKLIVN